VRLGLQEPPQPVGPGQSPVEQPGHLQHALDPRQVALLAHDVEEVVGEVPQHVAQQLVAAVGDPVERGPADRQLVRQVVHVDGGVVEEVLPCPFDDLLARHHAARCPPPMVPAGAATRRT
jgi:hypothetical protein